MDQIQKQTEQLLNGLDKESDLAIINEINYIIKETTNLRQNKINQEQDKLNSKKNKK